MRYSYSKPTYDGNQQEYRRAGRSNPVSLVLDIYKFLHSESVKEGKIDIVTANTSDMTNTKVSKFVHRYACGDYPCEARDSSREQASDQTAGHSKDKVGNDTTATATKDDTENKPRKGVATKPSWLMEAVSSGPKLSSR